MFRRSGRNFFLLYPLPESLELRVELGNQLVDRLPVAFHAGVPRSFREFHQGGTALDLAGAGGAEQQLAALQIEHGSIHQGIHIILAAIDHISADERPVQKGTKVIPDKVANADEDAKQPKYLDDRVLETPTVALTNAAREVLRIADMTDQMLQFVWQSFQKNDLALFEKIRTIDGVVDVLYRALKTYLVRFTQETMNDEEGKRHFQILTFATKIEHVGDIIDRNLIPLAEKRIRSKVDFSADGKAELDHLFQLVIDSVRLAQTVFISGDVRLARQLVDDKAIIKQAEREASVNHLGRLQKGVPETMATSDLHMDIIRDLRRTTP